jgi:hypothetical protein
MKLLYIWDGGKEVPAQRRAAVRSVVEKYPMAERWAITQDREFFGPGYRVLPWAQAVDGIQEYFGRPDDGGALSAGYQHLSDWARFCFLLQNPGTLYLDTDITLPEQFDFEAEPRAMTGAGLVCLLWAPSNRAFGGFEPLLRGRFFRNYGLLYKVPRKLDGPWLGKLDAKHFRFPEMNRR